MKLESNSDLNEETLKTFIAGRASDINEAKNHALSKLQKKLKKQKQKQKQKKTTDGQQETNAATEVENGNGSSEIDSVLSQAVVFLTNITNEQLMSSALFSKKAFAEENCNSDSPTKRAIFHFTANEKIQSTITLFREQYPSWKKCKKQLMPKLEQNNSGEVKVESSIEAEAETNINGALKKRKMGEEEEDANTKEVKKHKKKKGKKKGAGNSSSEKENMDNFNMNEEEGAKQNGISPKKKKLNAIEKVLASGIAAVQDDSGEESNSQNFEMGHNHPENSFQEGGESGHIIFSDNSEEDETNQESTTSSDTKGVSRNWFQNQDSNENNNNFGRSPRGKFSRGNRGGNSDSGFSRRGRGRGRDDKFKKVWKPFIPRDSANGIFVSSDWRKMVESPKTDEDKDKPSLLRPHWLTNPEEYKTPTDGGEFEENLRGGGRGFRGGRGRGRFRGRGRY